jgi:hypothetical protein
MANEPERQIEKLLRACAKKRGDEAGGAFELHPATRRLLQGEVTRRFAKAGPERASFWQRLVQLSPRLAEGLVLLALAAVVISLFLPSLRKPGNNVSLARNEESSTAPALGGGQPAPVVPPPAAAPELLAQPATRALLASAEASSGSIAAPASAFQGEATNAVTKDLLAANGAPSPGTAGAGTSSPINVKRPEQFEVVAAPQPAPIAAPVLENARRAEAQSVAAAPATPPPPAAPSISGMTLALREKEAADQLRSLSDESAGQPSFANKSLDAGRFAAAGALASNQLGGLQAAGSSADHRLYSPSPGLALDRTDAFKAAAQNAPLPDKEPLAAQFFARVQREAKAKARAVDKVQPPVLVSFQLEQSGRDLRITDSDGSVYTGSLQAPAPVTTSPPSGAARRPLASTLNAPESAKQTPFAYGAAPEAAQTYSFRVAGTNRSLKQKVVFTGSLTGLTNSNKFWRLRAGKAGGTKAFQGSRAAGLESMQYSRISGQATVGKNKSFEVDAEPALPTRQQP